MRRHCLAAGLHLLPLLAPGPGQAAPAAPVAPADPLDTILAEVEATARAGATQPVVVFDLDATLFDNRPRTRAILQAWAALPAHATQPAARALVNLTLDQIHYGVAETLAGVQVTDPAVVQAISAFWAERFFGPWALHDQPLAGGPAFVHRLHAAGAFIVYLTGRDAPRMLTPTTESLALAGYPIGEARTQLIMKPQAALDDEAFKDTVMGSLRRTGKVIALFDNEPGNVNLMQRAFPQARVIFLETMHRKGAPPVDPGILRIKDFTAP